MESVRKDIRYSNRDSIDKSNQQDDNINGIYSEEEYPVTRWGEAVLHSTVAPGVIIYVRTSSSIEVPEITRVTRIVAIDPRDISKIRERIVDNEEKQVLSPYEPVGAYYGEEILEFYGKQDYATFQEYLAREKGRDGKETVSYRGEQQDRGRGVREGKSNLRGNGKVKLQDRDLVGYERVAIKQSMQKNKFWVHQITVKKDTGKHPAGASKDSKTGLQNSSVGNKIPHSGTKVKEKRSDRDLVGYERQRKHSCTRSKRFLRRSKIMTQQEFTKHSLSLLKDMVHQKYSQNTIEHALYLLCPLPRERMPEAVSRFKELANQGLSEIDFMYETSQVFKEIMGYESSPTETM